MTRALSGIRVIDMTSTVMGPSATANARRRWRHVIKVESAAVTPPGEYLRTRVQTWASHTCS